MGNECERCQWLSDEVTFWKEQQKLAANVAATICDLDEVAPALRQMLRAEKDRRREAEDAVAQLEYQLQLLRGTAP